MASVTVTQWLSKRTDRLSIQDRRGIRSDSRTIEILHYRLHLGLCVAALFAASMAQAQSTARTAMTVTADVRPSCRIDSIGSPTAPGWLTSSCGGGSTNRLRVSVDGRVLAPSPGGVARVSLAPGSIVQIDF